MLISLSFIWFKSVFCVCMDLFITSHGLTKKKKKNIVSLLDLKKVLRSPFVYLKVHNWFYRLFDSTHTPIPN